MQKKLPGIDAKKPDLRVEIAGIVMDNPIMIASGTFGYGTEYTEIEGFLNDEIGAIILKGTTLNKTHGNPVPRIAEVDCGIINSIGLQNPGIDFVLKNYIPKLRQYKTNVILNISGYSEDEYQEITKRIDNYEKEHGGVHGIEVNISCPNINKGGMQFGSDPIMTSLVVKKIRKETKLPLIVKLSPNVTDIKQIAKAAVEGGANALSLINTVTAMAIDIKTQRPKLGANFGGLSGPAIKPIAIYKIFETYQYTKEQSIPLIGVGGIESVDDIIEFILTGAKAVQIGTSTLIYKTTFKRIISDLEKILKEEYQETSINKLVGKVELNNSV